MILSPWLLLLPLTFPSTHLPLPVEEAIMGIEEVQRATMGITQANTLK
jgi:hypothetical protein